MAQSEDLSTLQSLYQQFVDEGVEAETGSLGSLGVVLDDNDAPAASCETLFNGQGFLVRDLLTQQECQRLIAAAESAGVRELSGTRPQVRSCSRRVFHEEALATRLFGRLRRFLTAVEIGDDPIQCGVFGPKMMLTGLWLPECINPLIRVCKYLPGQHFAPHYDGYLVHNQQCRSLQTFMVYLTDNTDGGATNFLQDSTELSTDSDGRFCVTDSRQVLMRLQPTAGSAIVFNHYRLHEGEKLKSGVKYILRSDVMFRREGGSGADATQSQALQLLQQAERLESRGEPERAVEFYRRAFKLCPELEMCT